MANTSPTIEVFPGLLAPYEHTDTIVEVMDAYKVTELDGYTEITSSEVVTLEGDYTAAQLRAIARAAELLPPE